MSGEIQKVSQEVYTILGGGRLQIKNPSLFIKVMASETDIDGVSPEELYSILYTFGIKQVKNFAPDIPYGDMELIVSMAIAKTIKDFDETKGASLTSFLFEKIKGELHIYRSKRESLQKKVHAALNYAGEMYGEDVSYEGSFVRGSDDEREISLVDSGDMVERIEKEDYYTRQIKAFRMAFSSLPRELQVVLYEIGSGVTAEELSLVLNVPVADIREMRNYGLSLILHKVIRSNHLTDDEKEEILSMHSIVDEKEDSSSETLS